MSLGGTQPGKRRSPHHVGKVEGLGDCQAHKAICHHIDGMSGGQLNE